MLQQGIKTVVDVLELEQNEESQFAIDKIKSIKDTLYQRVCKLTEEKRDTDVINHGDCWMNNLLFRENVDKFEVKLIDLQVMRYTSIAADLNYFLYINLDPNERMKNMRSILEHYLSCLHSCLKENGLESLKKVYSIEWLTDEMERFSLFGFMFGLWILPIFYVNKEEVPTLDTMTEDMMEEKHKQFMETIDPSYRKVLLSFVTNLNV